MKIYAITKDDFDSYRICALTTDADKAEKLRRIYSSGHYYSNGPAYIEVFEDPPDGKMDIYWLCGKDGSDPEPVDDARPSVTQVDEVVTDRNGGILGAYLHAGSAREAEAKARKMIEEYMAEHAVQDL